MTFVVMKKVWLWQFGLCASAIVWIVLWRSVRYPNHWHWGPLLATVICASLGATFTALLCSRRKFVLAVFDLIWILLATLSLTNLGWNYLERKLVDDVAHRKMLVDAADLTIQRSANFLEKQLASSTARTGADLMVLDVLRRVADGDFIPLFSDDSVLKAPQGSLSPDVRQALETVRRSMERREAFLEDLAQSEQHRNAEKIPFPLTYFGPVLLALGLGLRIAKAGFDVIDAKRNAGLPSSATSDAMARGRS